VKRHPYLPRKVGLLHDGGQHTLWRAATRSLSNSLIAMWRLLLIALCMAERTRERTWREAFDFSSIAARRRQLAGDDTAIKRLQLSVTVVKIGGDLPSYAFEKFAGWCASNRNVHRMGLAYERGTENEQLHIQGVMEVSASSTMAVNKKVHAVTVELGGWAQREGGGAVTGALAHLHRHAWLHNQRCWQAPFPAAVAWRAFVRRKSSRA
jgi:hypothetical protein